MIRSPKDWRVAEGHTLAVVAARAGINGRNPMRTYSRYETGERVCPPEVIEAIRDMSNGVIGAEAWQQVRIAFTREPATAEPKACA